MKQASRREESGSVPKHPPWGKLANGRNRYCGAWTLRGIEKDIRRPRDPLNGAIARRVRFQRLHCKCWGCSHCGPRKAKRYCRAICAAVEHRKLRRFVTLTLDPAKIAGPEEIKVFREHLESWKNNGGHCCCAVCSKLQADSVRYLRNCWNKLRTYLKRRCGVAPTFVVVIEFQKRTGMAHIHSMIDRYIDQSWLKESWEAVGGGQHVDIRFVDLHRAAVYISKYLAKEMLLDAPVGLRRVTTSRDIQLFVKKSGTDEWQIIKIPIDRLSEIYKPAESDIEKVDGELLGFVVREEPPGP